MALSDKYEDLIEHMCDMIEEEEGRRPDPEVMHAGVCVLLSIVALAAAVAMIAFNGRVG